MNFGQALQELKNGNLVSRSGWNGKGMFLFARPDFSCSKATFELISSIPSVAKNKIVAVICDGEYVFTPYICMFAADKTIVNGWLASQTDMLADDWGVVE